MRRSRSYLPAYLAVFALLLFPSGPSAQESPGGSGRMGGLLRLTLQQLEQQQEQPGLLRRGAGVPVSTGASVRYAAGDVEPMLRVLVRGSGAAPAVRAAGGQVTGELGGVVSAWVPKSGVRPLAGSAGVQRLEASEILYPTLDLSVPETRADIVHGGSYRYKGSDALVVVYDTGIDYAHEDFRNDDGTSRILYLWDQTGNTGTPPGGYTYGSEWTKADLDDELDGSPAGVVDERDISGHGTHVAGIAAGNGRAAGGYVGMAPEADLLIVKGGDGSFSSADIMDGIAWAFERADALGQPAVINLSLGGHYGPHDGTRAYEVAIDNAVGIGKAVVTSAGNSGNDKVHDQLMLASGAKDSIEVMVSTSVSDSIAGAGNDQVGMTFWHDGAATLTLSLRSPSGLLYGPYTPYYSGTEEEESGSVYAYNPDFTSSNGDKELYVFLSDELDSTNLPEPGSWWIFLESTSGAAAVDMWVYYSTTAVGAFAPGSDGTYSVGSPGTSEKAITVGSYATKADWTAYDDNDYTDPNAVVDDISAFSSLGPTRDGRLKPEITAPGEQIASALSADASASASLITQDGEHLLLQGTSMSAPHVTGAIALLFDIRGYLTSDEVKGLLTASAVEDAYTGTTGPTNYTWGHGKMDVKAAADSVLAADDVIAPSFTVGILQNTVLSNYLDLYFAPSEVLAEEPLAKVDSDTLELTEMTTGGGSLFAADYELAGSGSYTVSVYGRDLAGNDTTVTVPFTAQLLRAASGGTLVSAGGEIQLHMTAGAVEEDQYVIAYPSRWEGTEAGTGGPDGEGAALPEEGGRVWRLLPEGRELARGALLRIDYRRSGDAVPEPETLVIARWTDEAWVPLRTRHDAAGGTVEAAIQRLGTYRLQRSAGETAVSALEDGLQPNYPNPFNAATQIRFSLARSAHVELEVRNVRGQRVRTLLSGERPAGAQVVTWDGRNDGGRRVSTGIYLVLMRVEGEMFTRKIMLLQ
ncbi:MAG: S8 family serine peptidase [bacterium]